MSLSSVWRSSLKWKLVITFILITVINMAVIGFIVVRQVREAIDRDAIRLSQLAIQQSNLNLGDYFLEYEQFLLNMTTTKDLESWSSLTRAGSLQSIIPYKQLVENYIRPFNSSHPDLVSVTLYSTSGDELYYTEKWGVKPTYTIAQEPWFESVSPGDSVTYFTGENDKFVDSRLNMISSRIISMVKRTSLGGSTYVQLDIEPALLNAITEKIRLGEHALGYIIDGEGQPIAQSNEGVPLTQFGAAFLTRALGESAGSIRLPGHELAVFETIPHTDWKLILLISTTEVANNIYLIQQVFLLSTIACIVLSSLIIFLVSSSMTRRLSELMKSMSFVKQGQVHVRAQVKGIDEISHVSRYYNLMLDSLDNHILRLAEAEVAEQRANLLSLQSQIDAHFLYNTLEIINSMATRINHREIELMTVALSRMFRYTADFGTAEVRIRDEVRHLEHYLKIILIRFREQFSYDLRADESCLDIPCPKVLIQPLAENAVKHVLEKQAHKLHLTIRICLDDRHRVRIVVADNGPGFPRELADAVAAGRMEAGANPAPRIGLLNIQSRLQLRYGASNVVFALSNRPSGGAVVELGFPAPIEASVDENTGF